MATFEALFAIVNTISPFEQAKSNVVNAEAEFDVGDAVFFVFWLPLLYPRFA